MLHHGSALKDEKEDKHLVIALAGNANVGKSVIFNQLTDSNQITGNWPGKTVERAEGKMHFEGRKIALVDLPILKGPDWTCIVSAPQALSMASR